jgi:hypothetical protein
MFWRVAGRPVLPRMDLSADDVAVPAQHGVLGDQQPQPPASRFRDHAEQDREQDPVVSQTVYQHQLRPVIETGTTAMNTILNRQKNTGSA